MACRSCLDLRCRSPMSLSYPELRTKRVEQHRPVPLQGQSTPRAYNLSIHIVLTLRASIWISLEKNRSHHSFQFPAILRTVRETAETGAPLRPAEIFQGGGEPPSKLNAEPYRRRRFVLPASLFRRKEQSSNFPARELCTAPRYPRASPANRTSRRNRPPPRYREKARASP